MTLDERQELEPFYSEWLNKIVTEELYSDESFAKEFANLTITALTLTEDRDIYKQWFEEFNTGLHNIWKLHQQYKESNITEIEYHKSVDKILNQFDDYYCGDETLEVEL